MSSNTNFSAAQETYSGFLGLLKWGSAATAVVTAIVILLISN